MSYKLLGLDTYDDYMKRVQHEAENIVDVGLPVKHDDPEIKYVNPDGRKDYAKWTGLQTARTRGSSLIVSDM